jgi:hypothetical protein
MNSHGNISQVLANSENIAIRHQKGSKVDHCFIFFHGIQLLITHLWHRQPKASAGIRTGTGSVSKADTISKPRQETLLGFTSSLIIFIGWPP